MRSHLLATAVLALASTGQAFAQSEYTAGFQLDGSLPRLQTGTALDSPESLNGRWTGHNTVNTQVTTQQFAGVDADGKAQWTDAQHSDNLHRAGGPPLTMGESAAHVYQATSNTHGGAYVALTSLNTRVTLDEAAGKGLAMASWSRNFELDPYASITFGGIASLGISGQTTPLAASSVFAIDTAQSFASVSFADAANRVSAHIGAFLTGFAGSNLGEFFSYTASPEGLLSLTITNKGATALQGSLQAGATVNVMSAPVPEPATWLSMALGLGLVGSMARRAARRRASEAVAA